MELVIDANILFSALIKNSHVRHFILLSGHSFYIPEYIFNEFYEHIKDVEEKSGLSRDEIKSVLNEIITMANIKIILFNDFKEYSEEAKKISPDVDDVHYFALALKLKCPIWSNDKKLQEQKTVEIYTNDKIIEAG
ncbi:hypothetical protein HYU07_03585 [Candidatus Woesearchaeota archaeon]|nr:hypothetical protein [Candidatus Woesearchaeota archaeon]